MKKFLIILLITILAAGSVFAAITGNANVAYGYDFDKHNFGFTNGTEASVSFDFGKAEGLKVSEGEVYAQVKATLALEAKLDKASNGVKLEDFFGELKFEEDKITNGEWYVSILGTQEAKNFASDLDDKAGIEAAFTKHAGLTAGYNGFEASFGQDADGISATLATPSVSISDTISVELSAAYSDVAESLGKDMYYVDKTTGELYKFTGKTGEELETETSLAIVDLEKLIANQLGYNTYDIEEKIIVSKTDIIPGFSNTVLGAKLSYKENLVSAAVASDVVFSGGKTNYDIRVDAAYDFLSANVYFNSKLNAKVAADLSDYMIPVKATISATDLVSVDDREFNFAAEASLAGITLKGDVTSGKFPFGETGDIYTVGAKVEQSFDFATIKADASYTLGKEILKMSASVENETLIPGATLSLEWSGADDILQKDKFVGVEYSFADGKIVKLFDDGTNEADVKKSIVKHSEYGTVSVKCAIAF